jgi:hypothetical protein
MRSLLGFFSLLAFGFLAAGLMVVIGSGTTGLPIVVSEGHTTIDLASLFVGLALGLLLATIARISWSEIPHRLANWLLHNERRIYLLGWAALFIAVLVYY